MLNVNNLILDRVRSLVAQTLDTDKIFLRLTSIEEPSLQCTAEGDEVTDAIGALITTMYRAKRARFSGTNSTLSLDLLASQYGTTKNVATNANQIVDTTYEIIKIPAEATSVQLKNTPVADSVKWIYSVSNNDVGTGYAAAATASATEFSISGKTITLPTGLTGKIYVQYEYETENAVSIVNKASEFPEECRLVIFAFFKDVCNANLTYSGKIIANKAKLNPEQLEQSLTSTGKHPFEFLMFTDYCAEEGEDDIFAIIVAE